MSQPWKLLPLAALAALALILGGVALNQGTASAEVESIDVDPITAGDDTTTSVEIISEDDKGDLVIQISGASDVEIDDVTCSGCGSGDFEINGSQLVIDTDDLDGDAFVNPIITAFTVTLDCDEDDDIEFSAEDGDADDVVVVVTCEEGDATATPTTTATATTTPGAAATVTTSASPGTITCSGTSIVTIQVRDEDGDPVPAGTTVTISTTIGSVSPSTGQTTDASGNAFVFLTAPASQGGTATVKAVSGSAEGSTTVTINCGATPTPTGTTAPPPTVVTGGGGVISPPNTGSAGLASESASTSWMAFAGMGLLAAAAFGAVGIVKVRA